MFVSFICFQSFYKKHFDTEEDRGNKLFLKAESKNVVVKQWLINFVKNKDKLFQNYQLVWLVIVVFQT